MKNVTISIASYRDAQKRYARNVKFKEERGEYANKTRCVVHEGLNIKPFFKLEDKIKNDVWLNTSSNEKELMFFMLALTEVVAKVKDNTIRVFCTERSLHKTINKRFNKLIEFVKSKEYKDLRDDPSMSQDDIVDVIVCDELIFDRRLVTHKTLTKLLPRLIEAIYHNINAQLDILAGRYEPTAKDSTEDNIRHLAYNNYVTTRDEVIIYAQDYAGLTLLQVDLEIKERRKNWKRTELNNYERLAS